MPENSSNQTARVIAVLALVAAFVLVIVTIASSGGDDDGGSDDAQAENGATREGERALDRGVWIVRSGDTLVSISEETGIETDELLELNPEIDPQAVKIGQRLILREGVEIGGDNTDAGGSPGADATGFGDEGPTGSGVGDGGPTGTTTDSDELGE